MVKQDKDAAPFIFGFAGWSGSGKTTLAEKIIAKAVAHDITIATLKHAHHNFDADIEGKDSWRHRQAGASQVLVASDKRMALFTEKQVPETPQLDDLLARLAPTSWVLVEGFKKARFAKLEIYDPALEETPLYHADDAIIAVIGQMPIYDCPLPYFHRDDVDGIFAFLCLKAQEEGAQS